MVKPPQFNRSSLTRETLTRLAGIHTDGHDVLSLYIDLDPSRFTHLRERFAELDSELDGLERRAFEGVERSHDEHIALRGDFELIRELFKSEELAPESARGLAIFCSSAAGVHELVLLPRPVEPIAVIAPEPMVEPLAELLAPERWCVVLISRRAGRIFTGTREKLTDIEDRRDDVHGWHSKGGWSQARYQRGMEHEAEEHIRATAELVFRLFQAWPFECLLIGGPPELHGRVEEELHNELRKRLKGHFEIDVERASADEVHRRALPLIEEAEHEREQEAIARLREGLAPGGHGASGVEEVLEMLSERRVQTLLVADGYRVSGFVCPRCGLLLRATDSGVCPADGAELEPREDLIEPAIAAAIEQDADVLVVRHEVDQLNELGSIAALLRF